MTLMGKPLAAAGLITLGALIAGCTSSPSSSSSSPAAASAAASSSPGAGGSSATPGSPSSPAATSGGPSSGASSSPGSTGAGGAGGAGGSETPSCATRDLQVTAGLAQGAAGSIYQVIKFKNISGAPCTLFGYPGVALAGGSPVTQVGAAASRSTASSARLVTLAAGATGNALLRITQALNYPSSKCHPVATTYLQIYPPNQTTPVYLGYKSTGCSSSTVKLLSIGVMQAGTGG
jgi:Protein of unknown function (DUF4232)